MYYVAELGKQDDGDYPILKFLKYAIECATEMSRNGKIYGIWDAECDNPYLYGIVYKEQHFTNSGGSDGANRWPLSSKALGTIRSRTS